MFKEILSVPSIYSLHQRLFYTRGWKRRYVNCFIQPKPNDAILDIGCGPGDILRYLPEVKYTGIDMSAYYIDAAEKRFGNKGKFICKKFSQDHIELKEPFDIVMANGVLHHLNDDEVSDLFAMGRSVLKANGRLLTLDGCWVEGQHWLNCFFNSQDRGRFVRTQNEYIRLARPWFSGIKHTLVHDAARVPYMLFIMECFYGK